MSTIIQGDELRTLLLGRRVDKAAATLPATTTDDLFTIAGGQVLITSLVGEVTTVVQTQANNTKLTLNPTATGASQDMCAVLDISADAVGEIYTISGTVGDALRSDLLIGVNALMTSPMILSEDVIKLNCAATNTGATK